MPLTPEGSSTVFVDSFPDFKDEDTGVTLHDILSKLKPNIIERTLKENGITTVGQGFPTSHFGGYPYVSFKFGVRSLLNIEGGLNQEIEHIIKYAKQFHNPMVVIRQPLEISIEHYDSYTAYRLYTRLVAIPEDAQFTMSDFI